MKAMLQTSAACQLWWFFNFILLVNLMKAANGCLSTKNYMSLVPMQHWKLSFARVKICTKNAAWHHMFGCVDWTHCCLFNVWIWLEMLHSIVHEACKGLLYLLSVMHCKHVVQTWFAKFQKTFMQMFSTIMQKTIMRKSEHIQSRSLHLLECVKMECLMKKMLLRLMEMQAHYWNLWWYWNWLHWH